jgi:NAD(P)-dependent dehydrogenase (short-subunit alcohol dehydrogenase family)
MRVFVAGGTGVIGRRLVPQLVARGHQVTATTTNPGKLRLLERLGAAGVVMDGLDAVSVGEAVAAARPDAIVNQMTALSVAHAGKANPRFFASTNRHGSEGIDHVLAAAEATGVSHVVAQGHASMNVVVGVGGAVLRYGGFSGPGAHNDHYFAASARLAPGFDECSGGVGSIRAVFADVCVESFEGSAVAVDGEIGHPPDALAEKVNDRTDVEELHTATRGAQVDDP